MFSSHEEAVEWERKRRVRIAADFAAYEAIKRKEQEDTNVAEQKAEVEVQDVPVVRKPAKSRFEGSPEEIFSFSTVEEAAEAARQREASQRAKLAAYEAKKHEKGNVQATDDNPENSSE